MTVLCVLWATLSTVASILACSGFYLPYWIQGRLLDKADAYFSSFRRCNYPRITPNATPEIVYECARYSSFWDIPSAWWQASTVTMGIGVAIAVIGALMLLAAASSFLPHILKTPKHTRILGSLQLLAAMICGGLVMYPIGWDNREVRESCGKGANVYNLGKFPERFIEHSTIYRYSPRDFTVNQSRLMALVTSRDIQIYVSLTSDVVSGFLVISQCGT
ncbi:LHFPL tetraspan subfamily member 6 protein isoform X2 [Monomorium pharaonis]|uniref:LHFPL tetraspan subfamily member 6 protein isoform X2 n=1 Tax=Monomorium pharaonis TaxID=307658 RepID=UPI00174626CC|nr:LHFPL tetraspan subfamily member 6 protein isoform X2 [Monomorium pharaonis]